MTSSHYKITIGLILLFLVSSPGRTEETGRFYHDHLNSVRYAECNQLNQKKCFSTIRRDSRENESDIHIGNVFRLTPKQVGAGIVGATVLTIAVYVGGLELTQCHKKKPVDPLNCLIPATAAWAIGIPLGSWLGAKLVVEKKEMRFSANLISW